jgi:hypothetical protein
LNDYTVQLNDYVEAARPGNQATRGFTGISNSVEDFFYLIQAKKRFELGHSPPVVIRAVDGVYNYFTELSRYLRHYRSKVGGKIAPARPDNYCYGGRFIGFPYIFSYSAIGLHKKMMSSFSRGHHASRQVWPCLDTREIS